MLDGSLSVIRRAVAQYDIPPSTLHDHISGKVSAGAVSGAPRYLDEEEEKELVEFLLGCAEVGYPKTKGSQSNSWKNNCQKAKARY